MEVLGISAPSARKLQLVRATSTCHKVLETKFQLVEGPTTWKCVLETKFQVVEPPTT